MTLPEPQLSSRQLWLVMNCFAQSVFQLSLALKIRGERFCMHKEIGVFDSGVGGLSVLSHIHRLLPAESLCYLADSAGMPYGCKSEAVVRQRCLMVADYFVRQGVKAIVVACNTATAAAIELLRERYEIPIVGMEPPLKPAVINSRSGVIGILATSGTVSSDRFNTLKQRFAADATLIVQPCPGLVERIEQGDLNSSELRAMLSSYLQPLIDHQVDTLVLGCTHYPFVLPLISEMMGEGVAILDTGDAIARELKRRLRVRGELLEDDVDGEVRFCCSGGGASELLTSRLWGEDVHIERVDI